MLNAMERTAGETGPTPWCATKRRFAIPGALTDASTGPTISGAAASSVSLGGGSSSGSDSGGSSSGSSGTPLAKVAKRAVSTTENTGPFETNVRSWRSGASRSRKVPVPRHRGPAHGAGSRGDGNGSGVSLMAATAAAVAQHAHVQDLEVAARRQSSVSPDSASSEETDVDAASLGAFSDLDSRVTGPTSAGSRYRNSTVQHRMPDSEVDGDTDDGEADCDGEEEDGNCRSAVTVTGAALLVGRVIRKAYPGYAPSRGVVMSWRRSDEYFRVKFEDGYVDAFGEAELRTLLDTEDVRRYDPPRIWFKAQRSATVQYRFVKERLRHSVDESNILSDGRRKRAAAAAAVDALRRDGMARPLRQLVGANNAAPRQAALPSATPLDTVKCNGHVLRSGSFVYAMSPRGERRPAQIISLYPLADDDFTATVRWLRCKPTDDGELTAEVIPAASAGKSVVPAALIEGPCNVVPFSQYCALWAEVRRRRALGERVPATPVANILWTHLPSRLTVSR